MKAYVKDSDLGRKKFSGKKYNKKEGVVTLTEKSKIEARNANRSRKKGARQEAKKEIEKFYGIDFPNSKVEREF